MHGMAVSHHTFIRAVCFLKSILSRVMSPKSTTQEKIMHNKQVPPGGNDCTQQRLLVASSCKHTGLCRYVRV